MARRSTPVTIHLFLLAAIVLALILLVASVVAAWLSGVCWACGW